jgi:hypothetical protein
VWNFFRNSVFEAVRYRYQLEYVAVDANGQTLPAVTTDWIETGETALTVRPTLAEPEVHA